MQFVKSIILLLLFSTITGWAQSNSLDNTIPFSVSKYRLTAYLASGEVIIPTGRIIRTIALSHPRSMEIANIWLSYNTDIKLKKSPTGEIIAVVSFNTMKLSGDIDYKGFDISDQIFPSLVSFKLLRSADSKALLATVKGASISPNDCSISVSLPKNTTEIPVIDQTAFFHSDQDFDKANSHLMLIDKYYTAGWLMHHSDKLLDECQLTLMHNSPAFLAKNLEFIVINDWMTRQHFDQYPVFQKKDSLEIIKNLEISHYRKRLIDQDFIRQNVISSQDLLKAANLFADNLSLYFDSNQPDFNRETYLTQMAESQLSALGFNNIREFANSYNTVHKLPDYSPQILLKASELIRYAMTEKASQLVDNEKFPEAMSMLNASEKYNLQKGTSRSQQDSLLIGKLIQRLYGAYLDFALKSINSGIYSITEDFYSKALLLKQNYVGMIRPDSRERYLASVICKAMMASAEKSIKSNDTPEALLTYEKVIRIAETARLKSDYEPARTRLEAISNRPSGYKPWEGDDLPIEIPEIVMANKAVNNFNEDENTQASIDSIAPGAKLKAHLKGSAKKKAAKKRAEQKKAQKQLIKAPLPQPLPSVEEPTAEVRILKQQILDNIQDIHLKIWTGDTLAPSAMLLKTDSLQQLLALSGDHSLETRILDLKSNLSDARCDYQKSAFQKDLDQVRKLIKSKDFQLAANQLKILINKPFASPCKVDKSEATEMFSNLQIPLLYTKKVEQFDSITRTQDPQAITEAFEKINNYYRSNLIEKFGVDPPDLLTALKSRNETPFLLEATSAMLDLHRPAYALELLKEINQLELKPDLTTSLQKRLGEMLASGDHAITKTATEMLSTYNLNEKWFKELVAAYKKQWKLF